MRIGQNMELPSFSKIIFCAIASSHHVKIPLIFKVILLGLTLVFTPASSAGSTYSLLKLHRDVVTHLEQEYAHSQQEKLEIEVGQLDRRLKLKKCPESLELSTMDKRGLGGNISVLVACRVESSKWAVHIPAQVYLYRQIPVAKHNLLRGKILAARDIKLEVVNVSLIRQELITTAEAAIGLEVKRNISQGAPLIRANTQPPMAIKRGEIVTIATTAGAIVVNTTGSALNDGRLGQKIRVRNSQSNRVITGLVVAEGKVQIH
jgi:flagellar basal body P-ring formation protein FlgA